MKEKKFLKKIIKIYKLSSKFQTMPDEDLAKHTDEKIEKNLKKELHKHANHIKFDDGKVIWDQESD